MFFYQPHRLFVSLYKSSVTQFGSCSSSGFGLLYNNIFLPLLLVIPDGVIKMREEQQIYVLVKESVLKKILFCLAS